MTRTIDTDGLCDRCECGAHAAIDQRRESCRVECEDRCGEILCEHDDADDDRPDEWRENDWNGWSEDTPNIVGR